MQTVITKILNTSAMAWVCGTSISSESSIVERTMENDGDRLSFQLSRSAVTNLLSRSILDALVGPRCPPFNTLSSWMRFFRYHHMHQLCQLVLLTCYCTNPTITDFDCKVTIQLVIPWLCSASSFQVVLLRLLRSVQNLHYSTYYLPTHTQATFQFRSRLPVYPLRRRLNCRLV